MVNYTAGRLQIQVLVKDKEFFSVTTRSERLGMGILYRSSFRRREEIIWDMPQPDVVTASQFIVIPLLSGLKSQGEVYIIDVPAEKFSLASFAAEMKFRFSIRINNNGTGKDICSGEEILPTPKILLSSINLF